MRTENELINQVYAAEKLAKEHNVKATFRFFDNYARPLVTAFGAARKIRNLGRCCARADFILSFRGKNGRYYDRPGAAAKYGSM